MKRAVRLLLVLALLAAAGVGAVLYLNRPAGPDPYDDPPPSKDPPPLSGTFTGECGVLTYNGDGATVEAQFAGRAAELFPDGTYEYAYCWYHFGPCQYDVATVCRLWDGAHEWSFDCLGTGEDRLFFSYVVSLDDAKSPIEIDRLDMTFDRAG